MVRLCGPRAKFLAGLKGRLLYRLDGSRVKAQDAGIALSRRDCAKNNLRQVERWARGTGAPWATGDAGTRGASSAPLFEPAPSGPAPYPAENPPSPSGGCCTESFQAERGGPIEREAAHQVDALDPTLLLDEREPFVRW